MLFTSPFPFSLPWLSASALSSSLSRFPLQRRVSPTGRDQGAMRGRGRHDYAVEDCFQTAVSTNRG